MSYVRYRKHPRIYKKKDECEKERTLVMSAATAAGILALAFINGVGLGFILRKKLHR